MGQLGAERKSNVIVPNTCRTNRKGVLGWLRETVYSEHSETLDSVLGHLIANPGDIPWEKDSTSCPQ